MPRFAMALLTTVLAIAAVVVARTVNADKNIVIN
jgi:hypothetical protein